MSLRIIYGRAGCGKSHYCLSRIREGLESNTAHPLVLVVPEQFTLQAERSLVGMVKARGIIRAEVLSFRRMAYRVFNEVGGTARRHINPAGKSMLVSQIIEDMKDQLHILSKAAMQPGFVNVLSQTISEFKRYNVTPDDLKTACQSVDDRLLGQKLEEIAGIYAQFENRLHRQYMDSDDDLTMLAQRLDASTRFNGAIVWIDGFSGFTPQEYKVIEKLLLKAATVNVCMCTDSIITDNTTYGIEAFSPVNNTVSKLLKLAADNGVTIDQPVHIKGAPPYRYKDSPELAHLEREFFAFPYSAYNGSTSDISIFTATNVYSEVEDTARAIIDLCRDRGLRYRDIVVVTGDLGQYDKLITSVFSEYGIPHFIDTKKEVSRHPLVQLIQSALGIFIKNWSYEAVFRYLKTGITGINDEDIDLLENYVLANGIKGSMWTKWQGWERITPGGRADSDDAAGDREMLNRIGIARRMLIEPLEALRAKIKGQHKAIDICSALYQFLCDIGIPERMEQLMEEHRKAGRLDLANECAQIWNITMEVMDQVVEVVGDRLINIRRFDRLLAAGFGEYRVGLIPPALDQVMVGNIERSKSHRVKALFVLGVNDGVFPSAPAGQGILSDAERERLRSIGVELAQGTRTKAFEEQHMVYGVLTTAEKYLRLSYPIANSSGGSMRPSVIISRLRRIFPGITESSNLSGADQAGGLDRVTVPLPTFNELICAMRRKADGLPVDPVWSGVQRWYIQDGNWNARLQNALAGLGYTNHVTTIGSDKVARMYGRPVFTSVSRLETYASCPFSHFIRYGLKAGDRKIFGLTPPDLGSFIHSAIDLFSKRMADDDISWRDLDMDQCAERVSGVVDELLGQDAVSVFNRSGRYRYLAERLKRVLTRALWLISEHVRRSDFEPLGYEVAFGNGERFSPIAIELPSGERAYLTGRIDRIDIMKTPEGTYVRIVDYKSGAKDFTLQDLYHGLQIQLIAYLDALRQQGAKIFDGDMLPGGVFYFRIDDPIVKKSGDLSEQDIEREIMKALKMKGLMLADVGLVRAMDSEIDGDSLIIPVRINNDNTLGSRSSAATAEQFELLSGYVRSLLAKTVKQMLEGDISIRPYRKKSTTACKYCDYLPICRFDPAIKGNDYRVLRSISDDEFWDLIKPKTKSGKGEA